MKQFNLKEYLKDPNKKVVTRDGKNVRIICTDRQEEIAQFLFFASRVMELNVVFHVFLMGDGMWI